MIASMGEDELELMESLGYQVLPPTERIWAWWR